MPDFRELSPINTPEGRHSDPQGHEIHRAIVKIPLNILANAVEKKDRDMSHILGCEKYMPVDGPTECSMTVRLPGEPEIVSSDCQIEATIPVESAHDGTVVPSVWLRGRTGNRTIFASVIDSQMKFPEVLQRVIIAPGETAELTNQAVHEFLQGKDHDFLPNN